MTIYYPIARNSPIDSFVIVWILIDISSGFCMQIDHSLNISSSHLFVAAWFICGNFIGQQKIGLS